MEETSHLFSKNNIAQILIYIENRIPQSPNKNLSYAQVNQNNELVETQQNH